MFGYSKTYLGHDAAFPNCAGAVVHSVLFSSIQVYIRQWFNRESGCHGRIEISMPALSNTVIRAIPSANKKQYS
jgi:hypothetical protein